MKFLQSKRLAIWLIVALAAASLAGVIIPQEVQDQGGYAAWAQNYRFFVPTVEFLGLNKVFQTKWFLSLGLIFLVNLASCTVGQINRVWKLRQTLRRDEPVLPKAYWGVFGNCIFHIGLVVIVVGGLLTLGYKMSGYVEIAEGETFVESHRNYGSVTEGPLVNENHLGFEVTVTRLERIFTDEGNLDYVRSRLTVADSGREPFEATAELGQPFTYRGTTFYYFKSGFAPFITIKNPQDQTVLEGYALFNSMWHNNTGEYTMDLMLPGTDLVLKARFYPDAIIRDRRMTTKTLQLANPVIQALVMEKNNPAGEIEFRPDRNAIFKGWTIGMGDVRLWAGFEVVRDPGAPVIFSGFLICLAGLIMSFLFTTRKPGKEQEDGC